MEKQVNKNSMNIYAENHKVTAKLLGSKTDVTGYVYKTKGRTFILVPDCCDLSKTLESEPRHLIIDNSFEVDESTIQNV